MGLLQRSYFLFIFKIKALFRFRVYIIFRFGIYVYKKPTILNLNAPLDVIFS